MKIGLAKEPLANESRVALTPENITRLSATGATFVVEAGAGLAAGFSDQDYRDVGAQISPSAQAVYQQADILLRVNLSGAMLNQAAAWLESSPLLIGMMDPFSKPERFTALAEQGISSIAMELIPRISRAQSMDVLSSMATLAGYKAVLLAANVAPRIYPMMMTAAGNLSPARVFIMGAGVAGLQAAATAKRMGAVVEAYDVRPAAREQIISVGAKPIELALEADSTEAQGGYAKQQGEAFLQRQRALMTAVLSEQDIVITTAAIPGARSPVLITAEMVKQMKPGAVIVDLASERGGNCELTRHGEVVIEHEVTIMGPDNITATVAHHASQMYGNNIENLLHHLINEQGDCELDFDDEIIQQAVVTHGDAIINNDLRERLDLPPLVATPLLEEVA
ncbi:Re/Si-specific NAD(P)(+) transhydrogenase subunit alpha [Amphritea sp. 1_MG-2023]|uniref:Re/Si-specific NAD(P)(+) transhydrogenase subunit alpha n=1 Tax=Amphritea sp. 1_MG-2023 TaxID=3062670 RepID=UPI0026E25A91|nr:Re/Si-specific NAD(P)(+) transhydrogenase subunit alpha [Amphritea sp. 1_MG-2023]MDO6564744.1 Re/Si-specific NAD(P)(+) transhydrogenase subunit alpha [Amphritea sp. 1_MG-2023]